MNHQHDKEGRTKAMIAGGAVVFGGGCAKALRVSDHASVNGLAVALERLLKTVMFLTSSIGEGSDRGRGRAGLGRFHNRRAVCLPWNLRWRDSRSAFLAIQIVISFLLLFATSAQAATSISQNGITWNFTASHTVGTFVDGSPWVVENSPGVGVQFSSITPAYSGGRHGYEVNPVGDYFASGAGCGDGSADPQSLDDRIANNSHCFKNPTSLGSLRVSAGETIVKVISYTGSGDCYGGKNGAVRSCIDTASALTVLASAPPANAFRPPFVKGPKPMFLASYDIAQKLPELPDLAQEQISLADAEAIFGDGGPWTRQEHGTLGRLNPRLSIRTIGGGSGYPAGYGCDLGMSITAAALRTLQSGTPTQKAYLVAQVVQKGIDFYYMQLNHDRTWGNRGGCVTNGIKPTIMYAGYLLSGQPGASDMLNYSGGSDEDSNVIKIGNNEAIWGFAGATCYTSPGPNCGGGNEFKWPCDARADAGGCAYGTHSCSSQCGSPNPQPELSDQRSSGKFSMTNYQRYTHARFGPAALARILDLEDEWNYPPFFEYTDRIATPPWNYYCSGHCNKYLAKMHEAFGCSSSSCQAARAEGWSDGGNGGAALPAPVLLE